MSHFAGAATVVVQKHMRLLVLLVVLAVAGTDAVAQQIASPNPEADGRFGRSVAGIGDIDGDGTPDFAVGAYNETAGAESAGRVYLYSGADNALIQQIPSPAPQFRGYFGYEVSGGGDVDGDGIPDIIVSAFGEDGNIADAGRVYVLSGSDRSVIYEVTSPDPDVDESYGSLVTGVEDLDGGGRPEFVVSAEQATVEERSGAGRAYVYRGEDGTLLRTLVSPDPEALGLLARRVWSAGDYNNDGTPDVAISATGENGNRGRVYIFSGAHIATGSGTAILETVASPNAEINGLFGSGGAMNGDVDGDGIDDFVVGAVGEMNGAGRVYIFSGADATEIRTIVSPNPESSANPNSKGYFGNWVAGLGDVNGDGVADVVVTAWREDGGAQNAGRAYLFSGANGSLVREHTSESPVSAGHYGEAFAVLGDLDTDGVLDFAVGAAGESVGEAVRSGRAYILSGATGLPVPIEEEPTIPGGADWDLAVWPNPIRGQATVGVSVPATGQVDVSLYDVLGKRVAVLHTGVLTSGQTHEFAIQASDLPAGAYLVRVLAEGFADTRVVAVVK